jgi:hypothetical protein
MREHRHRVDISVEMSGPHDFAVRGRLHKSRSEGLVPVPPKPKRRRISAARLATLRVHRIPHPTFVTIAKRPSYRGGMESALQLFLPNREAEYFFWRGWTGLSRRLRLICPSGNRYAVINRPHPLKTIALGPWILAEAPRFCFQVLFNYTLGFHS